MYYLIWVVVGLAFLFSHNLLQSRPGRAIRGLRGGATLLASVGADAYRVRLSLFVTAALFAGLAGWLYAHMNRFVSPSPFDVRASIEYLLMAVAGGLGQLAGALVGAALVLVLKNGLQDVLPMLTQRAGQLEAVAFAALFILLLHFARGGLMGLLRRWTRGAAARRASRHAAPPVEPLPHRQLPARGSQVLSVNGAVKRFGGLVAVNDVSFDVKAGEIVGLIGPNGAGKSTMFNLLTCTLPMTSGQVRFLGQDIAGMPQRQVARLGLARTFQHVKLRPRMSLWTTSRWARIRAPRSGVLKAGLRLDRTEENQILQEAQRQLDRIGLGDRAHELAGSLPLGTQRILEIARALAADPVLLVLDEPAAGLRRKEKMALGDLLRKLREEGVTILIVEHDMDFVMKLVDRLVVMNFGSKLVEGTPSAVRAATSVCRRVPGHVMTRLAGDPRPARPATASVEAVRGVSLDLQADGQIITVIGPNGAGKTTCWQRRHGRAALQGHAALRGPAHLQGLDVEARVSGALPRAREARAVRHHAGGRQPGARRLSPGAPAQQAMARLHRRGLHAVPAPEGAPRAAGRHALGRRAADAGGGPRADVAPHAADARRAQPGPGAAGGAGDLPHVDASCAPRA
jgi:branched-chain amino acid transport system permease protein